MDGRRGREVLLDFTFLQWVSRGDGWKQWWTFSVWGSGRGVARPWPDARTHTEAIRLPSKHSHLTHTHLHGKPPLVTQSPVTGHSGRWLTLADLFIFLPWPIITHTKYHLLASALYSGNNTSLMSGQTHVLTHRAWGGRWNDVRSAGVVTELSGKINGFCLKIN